MSWVCASAVVLAAIAFGLIRQSCNDIGWHLATARVEAATGHWPVVNTFSHTHPDYPLDQQYPVLQSLAYWAYGNAGWGGLSILNCVGWLVVFLLFVRWGGPWRWAVVLHLPWMLALMVLQRRMILRPDMLSMLFLGCELLVMDAYLRACRSDGRRRPWTWLLLLPVIHWLWANSHQLFPLSLAVQGVFIGHVVLARLGDPSSLRGVDGCGGAASRSRGVRFLTGAALLGRIDSRDFRAGVVAPVVAILASILVSFCTPLGSRIVHVIANTSGSLSHHRGDVQEFAYIWQRPWELQLAVACGVLGIAGIWRTRHRVEILGLGLWCGTLVMTLSAVRGLVFFGPVSVALFVRSFARDADEAASPTSLLRWPALRGVMAICTLLLAGNVLFNRWVRPPLALGGTQPGVGQSLGDWPSGAIAFIRKSPPPGVMMNVPWSLGSPLIWELPQHPIFVDARLEAYPRDFLVDCMAAERNATVLNRLIETYNPTWIVANHRDSDVRARMVELLRSGSWSCVYADTLSLILVKEAPSTQDYLRGQRITPTEYQPLDVLSRPVELRRLQLAHFDRLIDDLRNAGVDF